MPKQPTTPVRIYDADRLTVKKIMLAAEERGVKLSLADWIGRAVALLRYEEMMRPLKPGED